MSLAIDSDHSGTSPLGKIGRNFEKPFLFLGLLLMILVINYQTLFRYLISVATDLLNEPYFKSLMSNFSIDVDQLRLTVRSVVGWAVWTEELARYLFIWISYIAVSLSILNRSAIRIDVLHNKLPERFKRVAWIVVDSCCLVLTVVIGYMGFDHVSMQLEMPQTTPALHISYFIPYLILPLGFGLMTLRLLQDIWVEMRRTPTQDIVIGIITSILLFTPVLIFDEWEATPLLFGYFVLFLIIGVPVAFSLGLAGLTTVIGAGTLPIDYLAQIAFTSIDSFPIMAIPFFIAAGVFMGAGGLSKRLLAVGDELVGALPGGMALASILTCVFFGAISGSGPATVAAVGTITIPAMIARGYDKYFAAAVVAAAGTIGVMIPPSNPFVVYGVSAQASVGKLFIAGIIPGILTAIVLMIVAYLVSKRRGWRGEERDRTVKSIVHSLLDAKWALLVPVIVLGGIYGGIMTPTEAAAVAALYGLVAGMFIYREMSLKGLWEATLESAGTSSIIIVLIAMATIFGNIMTIEQIPEIIADSILAFTSSKILILLLINIFLLCVGIFMEALAAIVILTPILLPLVVAVGVDPIHFGVIMVMNLSIGFITPPVGVNLFVASGIAKVGIDRVARAALMFLAVMILMLLIVTYFPAVSLFLL